MKIKHWKKISSTVLFRNPWWTYRRDEFQIPGGIGGEYHYVHTHGSSMVIPVTADGSVLLVKQYRYLCDKESIEFPCGGVKEGKTYEEMASIELAEETGFRAGEFLSAAEFNPYNGVTDEICTVFIARGLEKTVAAPDETEEFELLTCTPSEIDRMIDENIIWDGMTIAAWGLAKQKVLKIIHHSTI